MTQARIGISGWNYAPWRGVFYPPGLPHRRELEYVGEQMSSVEINGTFYSLKRPNSFLAWYEQTPPSFEFAVKGGRFITHMKKLRDVETPLANFFASGVLALADKLGPFLWQLPATLPYDRERLDAFLASLPRTTHQAATLAARHDQRLEGRAWTKAVGPDRPLRHALEVRHESYRNDECLDVLRRHGVAMVLADTAGKWPWIEETTADFHYARLHGDVELYTSGYTDAALRIWADRVRSWLQQGDAYVYFDNDVKVRAPFDAMALGELIAGG